MKWNLLDEHLTSEEALRNATLKERFIPFFFFIWVGTLFIRFVFRGLLETSSPMEYLMSMMGIEVLLTFCGLLFYNRVLFQVKPSSEALKRAVVGTGMILVLLLMIKAFQIAATALIIALMLHEDADLRTFLNEAYWLELLWVSVDFAFIFVVINMMNILKNK